MVIHTSIRLMLVMAAHEDMKLKQLDVNIIFLYGDLEKMIYMRQLEGLIAPGSKHLVCKLRKSLYRLKQSLR